MSGSDLKQRLVAILAADAAGYSRLMAANERATVATLDACRGIFKSLIEINQGRVIDMAGDSVLAAFETAAGAVTAALSIQRELVAASASVPEDQRMRFRIGIHLGDVMEKGDGTIYGDGVNIAARLQALAELGGVTVSDAVQGAVRGKVPAGFVDQGEQTVKNIPHPVRTFRMQIDGNPPAAPKAGKAGGRALEKPSIAVLPFNVLAEDSRLGFLADGLVEDVIALLARVAGFTLISRSSTFVFRDRSESLAVIARQLGVRYIVEGSVRPVGDQLRVSTQLTEADSGRVLWSGRFESRRNEAADLQDDIARGVISELEPELTRAEIALIRRQRPENVDAWGCYRQAIGAMALKGWTGEALDEARTQLQRAFDIDPTFALVRAYFALLTALGKNTGLARVSPSLAEDARSAAEQAIAMDDGSSEVLGLAGCALADLGYRDRGMEILERALALDPSNAQAHVAHGATLCLQGQIEPGIEKMRYGMRISPRDRRLGFWGWALGAFLLRANQTDEALQEARVSAGRDSKFHLSRIVEAAALQRLGRIGEARAAIDAARRLRASLTLEEVALSHGKGVAEKLAPLWDSG